MEEKLIRKLITSITCGSCGRHYHDGSIRIIKRSGDLWLLDVNCPECNLKSLVMATVRDDPVTPEIITDLTEAELEKFQGLEKVRADDVLDMHEYLKGFDGDFPRIFRES